MLFLGAFALAEAAAVRPRRSPHKPGYSQGIQQQQIGFPGGYNNNRPGLVNPHQQIPYNQGGFNQGGFNKPNRYPGGFNQNQNRPGFNQNYPVQGPGFGQISQPSLSGSQSSSNSQSFNSGLGGLSGSQSSSSSQSFNSGGGRGGLGGASSSASSSSSSSSNSGGLGGGRRPGAVGNSGSQSAASSNSFSG